MKRKKQVLSVLTIAAFFLVAVASKVNKIHANAFSAETRPEDKVQSTYVLLEDGTRVTGKKVSWKSGMFTKDIVRIDDQKFKFADVQGYMQNGTYYKRHGNDFMIRLVHGTLNVYRYSYETTTTSTGANGQIRTNYVTRYVHYVQRGESGPINTLANQKDIQEAVSGCPLAVELATLSDKKMRRAIKSNRRYLNEIFEIYNNDCKPVDNK